MVTLKELTVASPLAGLCPDTPPAPPDVVFRETLAPERRLLVSVQVIRPCGVWPVPVNAAARRQRPEEPRLSKEFAVRGLG